MTFKRFLVWLLEKLIELQMAAGVVLCVKWLLPTDAVSFTSWPAFTAGAVDAFHTNRDDALFMIRTFMGGDWVRYVWKTYLGAAFVVGFYAYAAGLYILTSLFACLLSGTHYVRLALLAYLASAVICALGFWHAWDASNARVGLALLFGGLITVAVSARLGKALARASVRAPDMASDMETKASKATSATGGRRIELSA